MGTETKGSYTRMERAVMRRGIATVLTVCAMLLAGPAFVNPSLAQGSGRKLKSGPPPEYPALARKLNITGTARVQLTIAADGRVKDVKELGGNPLLVKALVDAFKKWRYEASTSESSAEVKFNFQ